MNTNIIQFTLFDFNFKLYTYDILDYIDLYIEDEWIYRGKYFVDFDPKTGMTHFEKNDKIKQIFEDNANKVYQTIDEKLELYYRHNFSPTIKEQLSESIDEDTLEKILKLFVKFDEDYEYADNFRAANIDNSEQMKKYKRRKEKGCCGFYDEIYFINGKKYMIGFNYGH